MPAGAWELTNGLSLFIEALILTGLAIQKLLSFIIEKWFLKVKNPTLKTLLAHPFPDPQAVFPYLQAVFLNPQVALPCPQPVFPDL